MAKQKGFLLIVAAVLIVILATLAATLVNMYVNSLTAATNQLAATQAFYLAESGLETAIYSLATQGISCANLNTLNTNLGAGSYSISGTSQTPAGSVTLSSAISATDTVIPVSGVGYLASQGGIMIDAEEIEYQGISGNNLINVTRGVDTTTAASHVNGSNVSQSQCAITITGQVPAVNPFGKRQITMTSSQGSSSVWVVGANGTLLQWNGSSWTTGNSNATPDLNSISMLNSAQGWAVGDRQSGNSATIRRWNPATSSWDNYNFALNTYLEGIDTVSTNEAWAVGTRHGNDTTVLLWNGSSWCLLDCAGKTVNTSLSNNDKDLSAIQVIDTNGDGVGNFGIAVGGPSDTGHTLIYNGTTWSDSNPPSSVGQLFGVYIASPTSAWAVGKASSGSQGYIIRWNGSSWSTATTTTSSMRSISGTTVNGTTIAWAVGDNGAAYYYNGSTWSAQNIGAGNNYYGVAVLDTNDAWAVGSNGMRVHWDGSSWTTSASGGGQLNSIVGVRYFNNSQSTWRENSQ